MKTTPTLKLLENKIRRILKEQLLTETMKSEKLRKLTKLLPKGIGWRGITDKFKIALDQVTDDQVQLVKGSQAKSILSKNQAAIGFFIWNGQESWSTPKGLMGVKQGSKFVSFSDGFYYNRDNPKDSSSIRGYKPKRGHFADDQGIRGTTGSSKDQSHGRGKYSTNAGSKFSAGDYWSDDVIVYIINTAELGGATTDLKTSRASNQDVFATGEQIKTMNLNRYKKAIAAIRSTQDPEYIKEYQQKLNEVNLQVNAAVQKILANPQKFKYVGVDHTQSYGKGRDHRTYTTSLLKLVTEIYTNVDDMVAAYRKAGDSWRGEDSSKRHFDENYTKIMNIIKSINATAAK